MSRTPMLRALCLLLLLPLILLVGVGEARAQEKPKVIVLGFDGADADLAKQWMEEGELPNLAKLAGEGSFSPMRVTIPSQTPVSWSTFSTGLNPGRHSIFDFLRRDPATYQPQFASVTESTKPFLWGAKTPMVTGIAAFAAVALLLLLVLKLFRVSLTRAAVIGAAVGLVVAALVAIGAKSYLPVSQPLVINAQQGTTFWQALGAAGVRAKVIRMPVTFPPKPYEHGHLLTGLGTPDLSARIGKPFYFTSELFFTPRNGGDFSIEVVELYDNRGTLETEIKGPPNKLFPDGPKYINIPMKLTVAEDRSTLDIAVSGQELTMKPGEWSDWVRFNFPFNPVIQLGGIGRFRLISLEPEVRLYLSPIQFDPTALPPILDISTPRAMAPELAERFGLYKTIGWGIDTWSISDGTIDEEVFMEDVEMTRSKYEEMLLGMLGDDDWDLLFFYFEFTDRVQHIMYRFFDPEHPMYDAEKAERWSGAILETYKQMDRIVGEVMAQRPGGSELFVVSDHGFSSFRRSVNYNTWFVKNGYMTLKGQGSRKSLEDLFDEGEFLDNVDWSQTKAYALGLGQLYINLAGREAQGIVKPEEYDQVVQDIKAGLEALVDEKTGENPVAYVFTRQEAYGDSDPLLMPDMVPSNNDGYRVGWQDSLGGFGQDVLEDNDRVWSGDHCSVYPPLVEGIFFSTIKVDRQPYMADFMPTVLGIYGVELPTTLDGATLLSGGAAATGAR
jgi:predicted AlkP superfamily phosphohydrolase/phosphomutase